MQSAAEIEALMQKLYPRNSQLSPLRDPGVVSSSHNNLRGVSPSAFSVIPLNPNG
jgi:hypothetical protein